MRCGLIWFAPLVPIDGDIAIKYCHMAEHVIQKHGLVPMITLTTVNDRCFDSPLPLVYDKHDANSVRAAKACYDELWNESKKLGLMPYRIPVDEMYRITHTDTPFWNMVSTIKNVLDPNHIIAPGRYGKSL